MNKDQVVVGPQREEDTSKVANREVMFQSVLIDNNTLEYQGTPNPLTDVSRLSMS
jgi:hypothetical protein